MKQKIFFILIITFQFLSAQTVYEPLHRDVYDFFERISQRNIVEFEDYIRPLSRKYFAEKLIELSNHKTELSSLELEEYEFFSKEFYQEISQLNKSASEEPRLSYFGKDAGERIRLFSYSDKLLHLNVSPIYGFEIGQRDGEQATHFWNGIYTYGYLTNYIGFSFDFRDNLEKGETIDKFKLFTPATGTNERSDSKLVNYPANKVEYTEAKATITASWDWGSIAVGKDFFEIGYGESGLLVLSQKAPSFPFIRLDLKPVDWLSFNYIHAWLSSDVLDSTNFYYDRLGGERWHFREKYFATHSLNINPIKGLNFILGESIVYSDQLEIMYLFPLMFFRVADHNLSRHYNHAGSNAQFFIGVSSKGHLKNTHLYGTLFIDEITINGLFDSYDQRNQVGFTLGGSVADLPIENLTAKLEFTKTFPYVYDHYIQTTTYQSMSHNLGHWMGSNADQIHLSLKYRVLRGLQATIWGQYIRKGEIANIEGQYQQPQPPFLSGLRKNYTYFGAEVKYEFIHELFARLRFQTTNSSIQNPDLSFSDLRLNEFYFSVFYGI